MAELLFKMATQFFNLNKSSKNSSDRIEGDKVFSHEIICIFGSSLIVCVLLYCNFTKTISHVSIGDYIYDY